jgi:hypothetical protein
MDGTGRNDLLNAGRKTVTGISEPQKKRELGG